MPRYRVKKYFVYVVMGSSNIPMRSYLSGEIVDPKDIGDPQKNTQMNRLEIVEEIHQQEKETAGKEGSDAGAGANLEGAGSGAPVEGAGASGNDSGTPQDDGSPASRRLAAIAKLSKADGAVA